VSTPSRLNPAKWVHAAVAGSLALVVALGSPVETARAETLPWLSAPAPQYRQPPEPSSYPAESGYPDQGQYQPPPQPDYQERYNERYAPPPRYRSDEQSDTGPGYYEEQRPQPRYREATQSAAPADIARGRCERSNLPGNISKQTVGGALGGVVGGLLGSRVGEGSGKTAATVAGALLGIAAGSYLGKSMDEADQLCTRQALEYTPDNRPIAWKNPDTDSSYVVTPVKTYRTEEGRYCREYTTRATVNDETRKVFGAACRRPDGTWEIVK
jgi:surface antigen